MCLAALDVRRSPNHRSELKSQLLMGEVVRVLSASRDRQWWRVENEGDGYRGWARNWGLIPATRARAARWRARASARVVRSSVEALSTPHGGVVVSPLFLNSRLIPLGARTGFRRLELPDGRRAWVPGRAVAVGRSRGMDLMERVRSLMGVPYLWGGRTATGFDCSGFTQQVLVEQGIALPRDAWQQFRVSRPLGNGEDVRPGDLVFFGRRGEPVSHVGLALGGGYFAHSRGRVRVNSINQDNPLCDKEILRQLVSVRRPRQGGPRGGAGTRGRPESA
ncbi:MAG TPA: C40 family peptidase [Candidatus Eisenbacteria bacterium]